MKHLGLTIYGCEHDEAELFDELSPRFGLTPTTTSAAVSETNVDLARGNRCISVGHRSKVSRSILVGLEEVGVEYVSTRSIGFDHIDLDAAETLGIAVANVVYAPDGVADHTVMLMLMAVRNAKEVGRSVADHDFRPGRVRGRDLSDMTVGVVGVGHIGTAVIRRLRGFGCRVLAYNNRPLATASAEIVSFSELLLESDIVTLHVPLNTETRHLIGRQQIEAMKPGAYLINTGRGALVDTDALIRALEGGKLAGAALDVLEGEEELFAFDRTTRPVAHRAFLRLQELPNAIITPHIAYYTRRVLFDTVEATLTNCSNFERSRADGPTRSRDLVRGLLGGT